MEDMDDMDMEMDTDMAHEKQLDKQVHGPGHTDDNTLKGPLPGYEVISDVLRSIIHPPIPVSARHHDCKHHDCGHHRVFSDVDIQHGRHLYDVDVQLGKQLDDGSWHNRLPGHEVFSDVPQGIIHPLPREQMYEARNLSLSSALAGKKHNLKESSFDINFNKNYNQELVLVLLPLPPTTTTTSGQRATMDTGTTRDHLPPLATGTTTPQP